MYQLQQFSSKSDTPLYYYIYYRYYILAPTIFLKKWHSSVLLYILQILCTSSNNFPQKVALLCITIYNIDSMYQLQQFSSKSVTPLYCIGSNNFLKKWHSYVLLYILWIICTSSNNFPQKVALLCITMDSLAGSNNMPQKYQCSVLHIYGGASSKSPCFIFNF